MVRRIAMVMMAGAMLSGVARAEGEGSWSSKYGMLFTVENVFQNGHKGSLGGPVGGSVGVQYNLAPLRAIRMQVSLSRASQAPNEGKETDLVTGDVTNTFELPWEDTDTTADDYTSKYEVGAGAAYMMRLTSAAISPYIGAGAGLGYESAAESWKDDTNPTFVVERDYASKSFTLGGQGILGLEWRLHKSVALFAEYALNVDLVRYSSFENKDSATNQAGTLVGGTRVKGDKTTFFNFDTGIGQGGMIGLLAFF